MDQSVAGCPPPSAAAVDAFGPHLPSAERYGALLAAKGVDWGLLGPRERVRLWDRHLVNSAALGPLVPEACDVVDVGSGAGLPGIPLCIARPDLHVTLLEPMARRLRFLELCRRELQLHDLAIRGARAEDVEPASATVVTARAVAPLARLVPLAWPLLRPGGTLLAVKGRSAEEELQACALPPDLSAPPDVVRRYAADGAALVTVVRFRRRGR